MRDALAYLSDPSLGLVREVRQPQIRMAGHVQKVLDDGGAAAIEAGVATGKTYAYLAPLLLKPRSRAVIATAKKQLQDQIIDKDIPALAQALGGDLRFSLVDDRGITQMVATARKGNGNYACRVLARQKNPTLAFEEFLAHSAYGDRAEYDGAVPMWWGEASAEDCVGKRCPSAENCGFLRLKAHMAQSKLVIVNHHILGVEMRYGLGKLVGGPYDVLVIDEAHKLADGIRGAFTRRMSKKIVEQISEQLNDTFSPFPRVAALKAAWNVVFDRLPNTHWREPHLREAPVFAFDSEDQQAALFEAMDAAWEEIDGTLERFGLGENQEGEGIAAFNDDAGLQKDLSVMIRARRRIDDLQQGVRLAQGIVKRKQDEDEEEYEQRREKLLKGNAIYGSYDERGGFQLYCAPVSLGGIAGNYFGGVRSKVLTSATLAVNGKFDHLEEMLGVKFDVTDVLASPFDYDRQGFVYIPRDTVPVSKPNRNADPSMMKPYLDALDLRVQRAVRLIELSGGGAFVLTTANDELDAFAREFKQRFPGRAFAQGHSRNEWDGDPPSALEKFLSTKDSILVGSKSFWEGVDVQGEALRLVIVAKLPFPQMNDPIIKAREKVAENPFVDVQMVDMLIDLRQGVGRLIRSKDDRGCVAILDNRVWTKRYGGTVMNAMPWSRDVITSDIKFCEQYLPKFAAYFRAKNQKVA